MKRLWLDADVVIRFLTGDPPELAAKARALMGRAERGDVLLALHPLTLAEVVYTLESFYGHPKHQICDRLTSFLLADGIEAVEVDRLVRALVAFSTHHVDFADAYLAELARDNLETVSTFDTTDFKRLDVRWMEPPEDGSGSGPD